MFCAVGTLRETTFNSDCTLKHLLVVFTITVMYYVKCYDPYWCLLDYSNKAVSLIYSLVILDITFSQSQQLSTYALTLYKYETKVKGKPITVRKLVCASENCLLIVFHVHILAV